MRSALQAMLCLVPFAAAPHAWSAPADEDELALVYGSDTTVSIATGSNQPLRRAPAVATVITAADMAAMGATDLEQVLDTVPGMHANRSAVLYTPLFTIRGLGSNSAGDPQILFLQNGVPITTPYLGDKGNNWAGLSIQHIARIEVIRGPGSALYGADAFAGVINIITKTAAELNGTTLGVAAGAFGTRDAWIEHGGKVGPATVAAYLQLGHTDGMHERIAADAQTLNDSRFGTHVSRAPGPLNVGHDAIDANLDLAAGKWRWRNTVRVRNNVGFGAGVNSALDPNHHGASTRAMSELSWSDPQWSEQWSAGFSLNVLYNKEGAPGGIELFPAGVRLGPNVFPDGLVGGPTRWSRNIRAAGYFQYGGDGAHQLRIGFGHDIIALTNASTVKNFLLNPAGVPVPTGPVRDYGQIQPHILPQRRAVDYVYVQDEWRLGRDWALTSGLRHDHYSDAGGTTNPRLALVWDASLNLTAKLLHGRAFRAPAFVEQYGISTVNAGNPQLKPERVSTTEAVLTWAGRDTVLGLNLFRYQARDIIASVANPAPAPGSTYANVGRQQGKGMELTAEWAGGQQWKASGNVAFQHSRDSATGRDAGYAPHRHAYGRLDYAATPAWSFHAQLNWVAGRARAPGDARQPVADYQAVDLSVNGKAGSWHWSAMLRNAFNADVREPSLAPGLALPFDLPMARRSWTVQLGRKL